MSDQILAGYIKDFARRHAILELTPSRQFLYFVNHCVTALHSPLTVDLNLVDTDGGGDIGIDGIAVFIDGQHVVSQSHVDHIIQARGRLSCHFVFVQSKYSPSFQAADIGTFLYGIRSFFDSTLPANTSDQIKDLVDLKNYIYERSIQMDVAPTCSLYYATTGEWRSPAEPVERAQDGVRALEALGLFSGVKWTPLDAAHLRTAYRALRNKRIAEFCFEKQTVLPPIDGVKEAYLGVVPCAEYAKLLIGSEGQLHRGLFYDNVRDFQGDNAVNNEIASTLASGSNAARFALLNNGVTVVAKSLVRVGVKYCITDYQIVNGCQTSTIIFNNRASIPGDAYVPVKLVITDDADVINSVIRATNRQTEVKPEAFESLSPFHRVLEEFYCSFDDPSKRLHYERRSNQYDSSDIATDSIVTLAAQSTSFLAMFLDEPQSTHRYYGEILASSRGRMFREDHRPFPYYVSALALSKVNALLRSGAINKRYGWYRGYP